MLINYLPILILLVISTVLAAVVIFLSTFLGPRRPTLRKLQPYESGMTPIGPAQRRMPVKFYLVAVLFILFDVEVIFFYPVGGHVPRSWACSALSRCWSLWGFLLSGVRVCVEKGSVGMGIEQKLGNMGVVTTTLEARRQLGADECDVADVVWPGVLRHRDDVGAGVATMT